MPRKPKKYHYTYKTTNTETGKYYYGMHSTDDLDDGYMGSGKRLRYSIRKYGKDCHVTEIFDFFENRKLLIEAERELITLNEIVKVDCLNLAIGGGSTAQERRLELTRQKISKSLKGRTLPREQVIKILESRSGYVPTDETKEKIRNSLLGQTLTDERRQKISKTLKEHFRDKTNHPMYGKTHSEETKQKMSQIASTMSIETKQKMSLAQRGIKKRTLECPHCGRIGGEPQMKQWHFDRCKSLIN